MAIFTLDCRDKPGALDARMAARADHLAFVDGYGAAVKLAGPFLSDDGGMIGSLLVLDLEDRAAADAFVAGDPYRKAGVFASVDVFPFKVTRGAIG